MKIPLLADDDDEPRAPRCCARSATASGLDDRAEQMQRSVSKLPLLLTPGAAEAIAVKAYRLSRTGSLDAAEGDRGLPRRLSAAGAGRRACASRCSSPIREATDLAFVPESLRKLAAEG